MIRAAGLEIGYGDRVVLSGLNFRVAPGEFVGILGPNGSGKSTLLHTLSGLLAPRSGSLIVTDRAVPEMGSRLRAQTLAVVPQSAEVRFPFSCLEIVLMGRYPHRRRLGSLTAEDLILALSAMLRTTTEHLKERPVTEVSGGERQRVVIARALAQTPRILLLDEATSSLDVRKKLEIFEILAYLNRSRGLTVLCAMHDLNLAALYCRRLMFIKDGRVLQDGPTDAVFTPEILAEVYDTAMEVRRHPASNRPYAVMLPLSGAGGEPAEETAPQAAEA